MSSPHALPVDPPRPRRLIALVAPTSLALSRVLVTSSASIIDIKAASLMFGFLCIMHDFRQNTLFSPEPVEFDFSQDSQCTVHSYNPLGSLLQ